MRLYHATGRNTAVSVGWPTLIVIAPFLAALLALEVIVAVIAWVVRALRRPAPSLAADPRRDPEGWAP